MEARAYVAIIARSKLGLGTEGEALAKDTLAVLEAAVGGLREARIF
jgi:hypothetical protein